MPSWDDDWPPDPGDSGSPGFLRRRAPGIREYQADPWSRAASLAAIWAAGPLAGVGYLIVRNYAGANLHCLADAIQTASTRAPAAIWQETGLGNLGGLLAGIIDGMLKALAVIAASGLLGAAAGGAVGFFFFGAGAAPGAIAGAKLGLELGIAAMAWLGLGLIAAAIGKGSAELAQATTVGVRLAWSAGNQPDREFRDALIDRGATELARAVGILVRLILEGIVLYLTRGLPASTTRTFLQTARQTGISAGQAVPRAAVAKVVAELRASKLGPQFAEWVERNWEQLLKNPKLNKPPRPVAVEPPPRTGPPAVTPSQLKKVRDEIENPTRAKLTTKELSGFEASGLKAAQIREGSADKIAIIGRNMGGPGQPGVRDYAAGLTEKGYKVEVFDGNMIPTAAKSEFTELTKAGRLSDSELVNTKMYAANREWAQKLVDQGYTVVDIGNPYQKGLSPFYEMEKSIIFGGLK